MDSVDCILFEPVISMPSCYVLNEIRNRVAVGISALSARWL